MPRIKALNESSSSENEDSSLDSDTENPDASKTSRDISPEEREGSARKRLYEGLKSLAREKREDAEESIRAALELIAPLTQLKSDSVTSKRENVSKVALKIEFSCWKNLGSIAADNGNPNEAIECYEKALEIDPNEANLWQKIGLQSLSADKYFYAVQCFQEGLEQEPDHWGCIECLCVALFLIGSYPDCILLISKAAKIRSDYDYGFVLRDLIFKRDHWCRENQPKLFADIQHEFLISETEKDRFRQKLLDMEKKCRESIKPETLPVIEPHKPLKGHTWEDLGKALLSEYRRACSKGMLSVCPLATSKWRKCPNNDAKGDENIPSGSKEAMSKEPESQPIVEDSVEKMATSEDKNKPNEILESARENLESAPTGGELTAQNDAKGVEEQKEKVTEEKEVGEMETEAEADEGTANSSALSSACEDSEAQSAADEPSQSTLPSIKPPVQKHKKKKFLRRGSAQSVFKRRSSRHVPGFHMEDDYLCASKPQPIGDRLRGYLPFIFNDQVNTDISDPESGNPKLSKGESSGSKDDTTTKADLMIKNGEEIDKFLIECDEMHLIVVLRSYVWKIAELSQSARLGSELEKVFVDVFKIWKDSQQLRNLWDEDFLYETRNCAWTFLVFLEIVAATPWRLTKSGKMNDLRREDIFMKYYNHVQFLSRFGPKLGNGWENFELRSLWLRAQVLGYTSPGGGAALQCCLDCFEEFNLATVQLPTHHCITLTPDLVSARILQAEKSKLLSDVENDFNAENFEKVVDVLLANLTGSDEPEPSESSYFHHRILCQSLIKLNRIAEAAPWLASLNSTLIKYFKVLGADEREKWVGWAVEVVGMWEECLRCGKNSSTCLDQSPRNLAEILIRIIESESPSRQIKVERVHRPWILLYRLAKHLEDKLLNVEYMKEWCKSMDSHKEILPRRCLMVLWLAHSELGHRRICTGNSGSVLLLFAEELMDALKNRLINDTVPSGCIDDALNSAEQCFYCLYNYPQKRKRHLEEHSSQRIELTWPRAHLIFDFVRPEQPCEFDQFRSETISPDAVQLLHQIESVVPPMLKPDDLSAQMREYILGKMDESPQLGFVNEPIVGELYHLLGDYYLKSQEFEKSVRYYTLDLCVWSSRFDSWAGLALAWLGTVQAKMDSVEISFKIPWMEMEECGEQASFCFRQALEMQPGYPALLLEYGSVSYQLHSYFSRIIKRSELGRCYVGRKERFVRDLKFKYLSTAKKQYSEFLEREPDSPEAYLVEYFLGKVEEKQRSPLASILPHYHRAAQLLHSDGSRCPEKIRYNGAQKLSLEMLEVHYRVHAIILKRIEQNGLFSSELAIMEAYADLFRGDQVTRSEYAYEFDHEEKKDNFIAVESEEFLKNIAEGTEGITVEDVMNTIVDRVVSGEKVLSHCMDAMQLIIRRFSNHYKAYRRLAIAWSRIESIKDFSKAEAILWGSEKSAKSSALFTNRRPTNLFEGIWRIPQDEIDRYGSFASHVLNITDLLLDVLKINAQPLPLLDAANFLSRAPEQEKKFISEEDRKMLLRKALENFIEIAETRIVALDSSGGRKELVDLCCKVYRMWNSLVRVQNKLSLKFAKLMCMLYEKLNPGVGKEANIDQIGAFCKILSDRDKSKAIREDGVRKKRIHPKAPTSSPEKRSTASSADESSPVKEMARGPKAARIEPTVGEVRLAFGAPPIPTSQPNLPKSTVDSRAESNSTNASAPTKNVSETTGCPSGKIAHPIARTEGIAFRSTPLGSSAGHGSGTEDKTRKPFRVEDFLFGKRPDLTIDLTKSDTSNRYVESEGRNPPKAANATENSIIELD